jgi:uncharacterized RDD family membrane protein YckC
VSEPVIIGEAVALDLQPATFASRAVSGVIDLAIQLVTLFFVLGFVGAVGSQLDDAAVAAVLLVAFVAVIVGYPLIMETATRGRTAGKFAMGLRTVRDDGGPIRFRQALVRALLEVVEVWTLSGTPALISSLASSRGKRLGDHLAGTYVVRERGAAAPSRPPMMPWHLVPWAQAADIAPLPDRLAISVRQFLSRAPSMHLPSRAAMAFGLAGEVSSYVAPQPPPGTHPEDYLAAVLAERRRRDEIRLARDAALVARLTGRRSHGRPGLPAQ